MMEQKIEIDLDNPEFESAWKLVQFTKQSVFLTGKAGTGKSTFLKYICANTRKKYVVLAPTGIAAVNAGGATLHSFFRLPFKPLLPDDPEFSIKRLRERLKYPKSFIKLLKEVELIIIDEISMVRADIIDFIDKVLKFYTGNFREPFGGKQMLFVGDIFQLEPVVTGDMRDILSHYYPKSYFFCAKAFEKIKVVPIELKKVYRQSDPNFINLLDRMRIGRPSLTDISMLNSKLVKADNSAASNKLVMTLATTRNIVDHINDDHLEQLPTPEVTFFGEISGEFPDNSLPTSFDLTVKEGAQVVFIKNDKEGRWVNGTIGKIISANEDSLYVETDSGERHFVEPVVWRNIKYEYDEKNKKVIEKELGSFTQFPIKLAWALTIHKSQGLTFNNVLIDIGHGTFSGGQAYVALSRCRSLEGLSMLSTINERDIFVNSSVVEFSNAFNNPELINGALERAKADDLYSQALKKIDEDDVSAAFDLFVEANSYRNELGNPSVQRLIRRKLSHLTRFKRENEALKEQLADDKAKFKSLAAEYVEMGQECAADGMEPTPIFANFNKAISIYPESVDAWLGNAETYMSIGATEEAIACYKRVYELAKDNYDAAYGLGKLYFGKEEYAESLNWYLIALTLDENRVDIHLSLAELYKKVGDKRAASRHNAMAEKLRKKGGKRK